ncbi:hypothetical protein Tco_0287735 [Tanacetum coccineum]
MYVSVFMERGFLSPRGKEGGRGVKEKQSTLADVSAMGSLRVEEMTTGKFSEDTNESGLHAYRYAFATNSGKLNDDGVDLAKHELNKEAAMDGVVPSANVASWINNVESGCELLKEDVINVPVWVKLHGVSVTGRLSYARVMIEIRADMKLKDKIIVAMLKLVGGRPVFKKNFNTNGNKKKDIGSAKQVSNQNSFDVLNSVQNNVELSTNGGTSSLARKEANSSRSSFRNVDYAGDHDTEDEVESVDNDMTRFLASKRVCFGTNSLLEQWTDTYENAEYDYDPYDDDMY